MTYHYAINDSVLLRPQGPQGRDVPTQRNVYSITARLPIEADGRVVFGATVEIEDLDSGDRKSYQIVGDDEADIKESKISVNSPIARALIGKTEGDTADVQAPGGVRSFEVVGVRYQ